MTTNPTAQTTTSGETKPLLTWYAWGQVEPVGARCDFVLDVARKTIPDLVPTTYEAASAYLRGESQKPDGTPDIFREMCVMLPLGLPEDRKVSMPMPTLGIFAELEEMSMLFSPTIELPPDVFGSPENRGILDSKGKLCYDPPTDTPQRGVILLSYFTKSGRL